MDTPEFLKELERRDAEMRQQLGLDQLSEADLREAHKLATDAFHGVLGLMDMEFVEKDPTIARLLNIRAATEDALRRLGYCEIDREWIGRGLHVPYKMEE